MAEEATNHLVEATFKVKDEATGPLGKISRAANSASDIVGKLFTLGAAVGAGFGLHEMLEGATKHLEVVKQISTYTGMTAEKSHGMVEAFESVGVTGEEASMMLMRLGGRMEMIGSGMVATGGRMGNMFKRFGVDTKHGTEALFMSLSKSAEAGKLHAGEMSRILGIRLPQAQQALKLFKKGPEELTKMLHEASEAGITDETIEQFQRVKLLKNEVAQGWEQISYTVGIRLLPVVETILNQVKEKIPEWTKAARGFADFLSRNMENILGIATTLGKVLLANFSLMKSTGSGLGGWLGKAGGFARGKGPSWGQVLQGTMVGGKFTPLAAGAAAQGITGTAKRRVGMWEGMGGFGGLARGAALLGGGALAAGALAGVWDFVAGKSTEAAKSWGKLSTRAQDVGVQFTAMFASVAGVKTTEVSSFFDDVFKKTLPDFLTWILEKIQSLWDMMDIQLAGTSKAFEVLGNAMGQLFSGNFTKYMETSKSMVDEVGMAMARAARDVRSAATQREVDIVADEIEKAEKAARAKKAAEDRAKKEKPPRPQMDFRHSRFDIKQAFAEGFDPDRVAVAFVNDLASLGERKRQDAVMPPGGVGGG